MLLNSYDANFFVYPNIRNVLYFYVPRIQKCLIAVPLIHLILFSFFFTEDERAHEEEIDHGSALAEGL